MTQGTGTALVEIGVTMRGCDLRLAGASQTGTHERRNVRPAPCTHSRGRSRSSGRGRPQRGTTGRSRQRTGAHTTCLTRPASKLGDRPHRMVEVALTFSRREPL